MNEQGTFAASLLDASRRAFAAGAVLRVQESGDQGAALVEEWGFNALVSDTELRVEHLAEALACGREELFALDASWLAETYTARDVSEELLKSILRGLRDEVKESLPTGPANQAAACVDYALANAAWGSAMGVSLLAEDTPLVEVAREFLAAVLDADRIRAEKVVFDALEEGASLADVHRLVVAKVQSEIGRLWQIGKIHVAEEHFGSRVVENVLARLRAQIPPTAEPRGTVLVASVAGNLHDIGARIVSDHFELNGFRSIFLGANMPADDLVAAVQSQSPDLIALSAGLVINVRAAAKAIDALRRAVPATPILIGGRPFALIEDLWKDVGADGCARDATEAIEVANRLLPAS